MRRRASLELFSRLNCGHGFSSSYNLFNSVIAMECFQNTVSHCDASCGEAYDNSDPETAGYYQLNNFDNAARAYVTLFMLMVANNWCVGFFGCQSGGCTLCGSLAYPPRSRHVIMNGHVYMVGKVARTFFIIFYLVVVMVIVNVVVAFVLTSECKFGFFLVEKRGGRASSCFFSQLFSTLRSLPQCLGAHTYAPQRAHHGSRRPAAHLPYYAHGG